MFGIFRFITVTLLVLLLADLALADHSLKNTDDITGFKSTDDITSAVCCKDFHLTDHNGKARTIADFRGKVVVLFFGYIQCPDVCPTTLVELNAVLQQLGADAQRVQVLFVTLDPERDTPELLSRYVPYFNQSFLGLYGDMNTTAATAKDFRVFYRKQPGNTSSSYSIDHSVGSYVFDTQGKVRLFVAYRQKAENLIFDIRTLLKQG